MPNLRIAAAAGAADQVLQAAAHFVFGVLVVRILGQEAFGIFAYLYATILVVHALHGACLVESYSIWKGEGENAPLILILLPAVALALIAAVLFLVVQRLDLVPASSFAPISACFLAYSVFWSVKAYLYKQNMPLLALGGTVLYTCAALLALGATKQSYGASGAMWSLAIGAAIGASVGIRFAFGPAKIRQFKPFLSQARKYSRWAAPAAILTWILNNGLFIATPILGSIEDNAALRAVTNVIVPINTILIGASGALLPSLARKFNVVDCRDAKRLITSMWLGALMALIPLAAILYWGGAEILRLIYGDSFAKYGHVMSVATLLPFAWASSIVFRTGLRAMGRPQDTFRVYAIVLFPFGLLSMWWGARSSVTHSVYALSAMHYLGAVLFYVSFRSATLQRSDV